MNFLNRLLLVGLLLATARGVSADEEQDLLALLGSNASIPQKCAACQRLRVIGGARSVPALAALLGEDRTGHAARFALEGMPFPEVDAALRTALGTVEGPNRGGIVDSLGWRRDPAAVPLLAPMAASSDLALATAAARALGRIGGPEAARTLSPLRDRVPAEARDAILDGLLLCAGQSLATGDAPAAVALVKDLAQPTFPPAVRAAAWRLLVLSEPPPQPAARVSEALTGTDEVLRVAALRVIRELNQAAVTEACLAQWNSLGEAAQLAVLDASIKLEPSAMTAVRHGIQSPYLAVRIAAWQALGDLGDATFIPALAKAAAGAETAERAAARDTLARMRGEAIRGALLKHLQAAPTPEQAELLRVLGERGDAAAAEILLQYASQGPTAVRLAALESLRRLALPETLPPLLELAARSGAQADPEPVLQALFAICQTGGDKGQLARAVVRAMQAFPPEGRRQVLPLLSELATEDALDALLTATRDADAELVKEAVRVLGQWPTATPAPRLLELASTDGDPSLATLALRSFIEITAREPQPATRFILLQQAMTAAKRPEERRQALGQLAQIPTPDALRAVLPALDDAALANEASLAAVSIAEKLKATEPALAAEAAERVLANCKNPDLVKRAWALRGQSAGGGPFIQEWLVAGPYRQAGANDALTIFDAALGPEKPGEAVAWKPAPRADLVPLDAVFPGQVACAAYLKTTVIAPRETEALLLLGSDDGVKAWLNGAVVHANNIDRGAVADQDMAPVRLQAGANELLLKITQGGGGWAACARLVSPAGRPLSGLKIQASP